MPEEANAWEQLGEQTRYYTYLEEMDGIHPPPIQRQRSLLIYLRSTPAIYSIGTRNFSSRTEATTEHSNKAMSEIPQHSET